MSGAGSEHGTGLFRGRRVLIGVVHLPPLPGSPLAEGGLELALEAARRDARALAEGGCDAAIVENHGDRPFFRGAVPPETVAAMALCVEVARAAAPGLLLGVNVLRNDARAALALCAVTAASFLRVNVHVGAAVTDQGIVEGDAAATLRERARLCPRALLFADVHVKHARPLGGGSLAGAACDALGRGLADAVVVTGSATGRAPREEDLEEVREAIGAARLLVGSGLTGENAARLLERADGAIAGTWIKREGRIDAPVDPRRVALLRRIADGA